MALTVTVMAIITFQARSPPNITRTSTSIPTESRKKGMKTASPTKWIRLASRLCSGMSVFSASPTRKAPTIASTPATSAR